MHLLMLLAASLHCPVLSATSVSSVFGEAQTSVKKAETGAGVTCEFKGADYQLTVEVSELATPAKFASFVTDHCQAGGEAVALKAIGNEAVACQVRTGGKVVEKVVGRVRNQAFVLALNAADKAPDARNTRTKLIGLSEQVSGNLF